MSELMKGHVWQKQKHKMEYPCIAEVKYDEIRCHVKVSLSGNVQFLSYAGKPLHNMDRFAADFRKVCEATGYTEFDTGFLVGNSFDKTYRWVRSAKNFPEHLLQETQEFKLYDLPECPDEYGVRRDIMHYACSFSLRMRMPDFKVCRSEREVYDWYAEVIKQGHEGLMVKGLYHKYIRNTRSYQWLKMKPEDTADGVITGVVQAVCGKDQPELGLAAGDLLDRAGSVQVRCEDGSVCAAHGIPHELGKAMLKYPDLYIGKWIEFKFMERDRQGGYRHPRFIRLREAKQ